MKLSGIRKKFRREFGKYVMNAPDMCKSSELTNPVVYDVEEIARKALKMQGKRCDEIVLCDGAHGTDVYFIENKEVSEENKRAGKNKNLRASHVCKQLQGGAYLVEKRLDKDEKFLFKPVLVTEIPLPPALRKAFLVRHVSVKKKKANIKILTKGKELLPLSP